MGQTPLALPQRLGRRGGRIFSLTFLEESLPEPSQASFSSKVPFSFGPGIVENRDGYVVSLFPAHSLNKQASFATLERFCKEPKLSVNFYVPCLVCLLPFLICKLGCFLVTVSSAGTLEAGPRGFYVCPRSSWQVFPVAGSPKGKEPCLIG